MWNLIFIFFICLGYSQQIDGNEGVVNNCFNINDKYTLENEDTTLIVNGDGKMCDCHIPSFEYQFVTTKITAVKFGGEIATIGKQCFGNFNSLKNIDFGEKNTLKMIDKYAFYNTKITTITLPESVEEIQEGVFRELYRIVNNNFWR